MQNAPGSTVKLFTFIKLPFVFMTFALSILSDRLRQVLLYIPIFTQIRSDCNANIGLFQNAY